MLQCTICREDKPSMTSLLTHMHLIHNTTLTLQCRYCSYESRGRPEFSRHYQRQHPGHRQEAGYADYKVATRRFMEKELEEEERRKRRQRDERRSEERKDRRKDGKVDERRGGERERDGGKANEKRDRLRDDRKKNVKTEERKKEEKKVDERRGGEKEKDGAKPEEKQGREGGKAGEKREDRKEKQGRDEEKAEKVAEKESRKRSAEVANLPSISLGLDNDEKSLTASETPPRSPALSVSSSSSSDASSVSPAASSVGSVVPDEKTSDMDVEQAGEDGMIQITLKKPRTGTLRLSRLVVETEWYTHANGKELLQERKVLTRYFHHEP
ncbi:uncharacterized protein [Diadema setosum]|uniref:uncharacterized protein n=1 Tax=Diadema setosum TaxID=31175 RepID=UPI003B3B2204